MSEVKITDLVDKSAIESLKMLDSQLNALMDNYTAIGKVLAKGLNVKVEGLGDVEKLENLLVTKGEEAAKTQSQLTDTLNKQKQVIGDTTAAISRRLMEQAKANKADMTEYRDGEKVNAMIEKLNGTYMERVKRLVEVTNELERNKNQQKALQDALANGLVSQEKYNARIVELTAAQRELSVQKQQLNTQLKNEEKLMNTIPGTYGNMSQQLELLKKSYKSMTEEEKASPLGQEMNEAILSLDAHLKDEAELMGEHQRNVGNYAIANGGLKKTFDEQVATIAALELQYSKLSEAEKAGDKGRELAQGIAAVKEEAQKTKTALDEQTQAMAKAKDEMGATSDKSENIRRDLRDMVVDIANLTVQYRAMSDAERESAEGQALKQHIDELTEKAGVLKDAMQDTKTAIENASSDTRTFDQITQGVQLCIDGFGLATGAAQMLGLSEEDLVQVQTKLQAAIQASIALQNIQNAVQKQSALMQGIAAIQAKAAAAAIAIKTAAEGKGVIVTKAATIAQSAFNAVAKANPYVLLATAILGVVAALYAFTKGSEENTEAEDERAKKLEEAKAAHEKLAQKVSETAGQQILSYMQLKKEWESLGDSFTAKSKFITDSRDKFAALGLSINSVNAAERVFGAYTQNMVVAFTKRAMADAYRDMMKDVANKMARDVFDASTYQWTKVSAGEIAPGQLTPEEKQRVGSHFAVRDRGNAKTISRYYTLDEAGAAIVNAMRKERGNAEANARIRQAESAGEKQMSRLLALAEKSEREANKLSGGIMVAPIKYAPVATPAPTKAPATTPNRTSYGGGSKPTEAMNAEAIGDYMTARQKETIKAQLEVAEEGSQEWLALMKQNIDIEKKDSIDSAEEKYLKGVKALDKSLAKGKISQAEYNAKMEDLAKYKEEQIASIEEKARLEKEAADEKAAEVREQLAEEEIKKIEDLHAGAQARLEKDNLEANVKRKERYAADLAAAGDNEKRREEIKSAYEDDMARNEEEHTKKILAENVSMYEEILKSEILTDEQRAEAEAALAKAKTELAGATADAQIAANERVVQNELKAKEKRLEAYSTIFDTAKQALSGINSLSQAIFDSKIQRLEDEKKKYDEEAASEQETITNLVERKVITEEEGEARKRAAQAKTQKKTEETEKKKAALQRKKALFDKAQAIAECGMDTALALMKLWVNPGFPAAIPMSAVVAALGAMQLATIIATPIPKYAKGTKEHKGGLAVVGDAGQAEVIVKDKMAWLTPDKPTLMDIPKGAAVLPSVNDITPGMGLMSGGNAKGSPVIVNNDYTDLKREMAGVGNLIRKQTIRQHRDIMECEFKRLIAAKI